MRRLAAAGLIVLADKGHTGAGDPVITPYRGRNKPASQKAANRAHARLRAPGEPTPSSKPGTSCASSAAAPGAPGSSPRPSMSFRPARCKDEQGFSPGPGGPPPEENRTMITAIVQFKL